MSNGLLFLAMSELLTGSLTAVRAHFAERAEIMATVGRPSDVGELVVLAWRGRETEARAAAAAVTRYATEHGHGWMLAFADYARAVLELGLGNYRAALPSDPGNYRDNPFLGIVGLPDLIEAASRCGESAVAAEATAEFAARALPSGTAIALGLLAVSRALLADDAEAERFYQDAIEHLSHCRGNLRKARAHLLYGEWLRRQSGAWTPAPSCTRPTRCSCGWEPTPSPSAPVSNLLRPESARASELTRLAATSPRGRRRSLSWPLGAPRTARSRRGCSSARAPWIITSARSSGSST